MPDIIDESTTNVEDDVNLLESEEGNSEEEEITDDKTKETKTGEQTLEETTEEDSEDGSKVSEPIPPHEIPSISTIKAKYPDIFKDFPSLKDIYFREREFANLFPSIDEAKTAFENSEAFETTREDIFKGDGTKFFSAIKEVSPESLDKFAAKLLPALYKVGGSDTHWKAALPLLENVARGLFNEGVKSKNEEMQNAAKILSSYLFDDTEIAEGKKTTVKAEVPKDTSVEEERKQFETEKLNTFTNEITSSATKSLRDLVSTKINDEEDLSNFVKEAIIKDVMSEVGTQMQADKAHIAYMDTLWAKAKRVGYSNDLKSSIVSAYLARAKSLIPAVRSRLISEARGVKQKSSDKTREKIESIKNRRDETSSGKSSNGDSRSLNPKNIDWSKTSDEDILNDTVTYRK